LSRLFGNQYIGNGVRSFAIFVQPFGHLGVELFFVLSGFLIGNILIKIFMQADRFSLHDLLRFWVRRWFRTLPLYWLILTTDILLYHFTNILNSDRPLILFYFFLQNLWYPHPLYFFGEAWSLSIEEWFYLTLPVALYIASRIHFPKNKSRFLINVFFGYLLVFVTIRFINAFHPINGPDLDFGIRKVVLFRLDAVMYGVLFAWLCFFKSALMSRIKLTLFLASIAGTAISWYLLTDKGAALCASTHTATITTYAFLFLLIPLLFSLCLPFAGSVKTISSKLLTRFFTHISKISYSIYLVHYSLVFIPFFYRLNTTSAKAAVLFYLLYWFIVISLSTLLYHFFERPTMKWRDKLARDAYKINN
jgi:peptidoglycan/LPS O-acetylase OafA/YrhL